MPFGHIDRPNFTFGESILFTRVINLIILLPVFGSIVVYLPLLNEKTNEIEYKSDCLAKMSKQIKCGKRHTDAYGTYSMILITRAVLSRPTDLYQYEMSSCIDTHTHTTPNNDVYC